MNTNFVKLDNALKKMGGKLNHHPLSEVAPTDPIEVKIKTGVEIGTPFEILFTSSAISFLDNFEITCS